MSSFYLIVKRGETSLRLGYSAQQVHIIIIIIIIVSTVFLSGRPVLSHFVTNAMQLAEYTQLDCAHLCGAR